MFRIQTIYKINNVKIKTFKKPNENLCRTYTEYEGSRNKYKVNKIKNL